MATPRQKWPARAPPENIADPGSGLWLEHPSEHPYPEPPDDWFPDPEPHVGDAFLSELYADAGGSF